MSSAPSLTEVREVFEALGRPGTPFTTTEVATRFECTDRTIYNRLETLVDDGVLETKKVGARGRVWWRPAEADGRNKQHTEETYQKLFESINEGLCIIDVLFGADEQPVDYRFLETNPAFDELTSLGDTAGKRIRELDVDHNDHWIEKYGAVAQTGDPIQFTEYIEHLGERWYEINAFRIGDPTEHTVAVLFDDVTERKHADNTLGEGEKRLEALLEATTEGVYRISPDWSEIYQLAGENFIADDPPNTWQEYIPDDDRERVGEAIEEAIETRSPFELEHRITRADGTIGWVDSRAVPIVEGGETVEWIGTATDITERKERESRIERYKLYLESVPDLVTVLDEDGIIRYDSPGVSDMLGYDTEERIGDSGFDYVHPDDRDRIRERFNNLADEDVSRSKEYRARTKDGDWIWLESRTRIPAEDHPLDDIVVTARDITKRKEQQRKRQEVIDRVADGIIELDANWQCQFVSGQGGALLNISESELLTKNFWDVFEDARGTPFETQYRAVMNTRESASFVEYYPPLEGWFDVQAYPNDDGGIAIYFRDVTERKEQQKARKRAETRYRTLLEFAPDPIITVDPTTEEIRSANQAAGKLLGCAPDELVGRQRATIHPAEKKEAYEALFRKSKEQGGTWRNLPDGSPNYVVTEDGEKIPVELSTQTLELGGTEVVFKSFREISAQIEHQRRLATLNTVTHELFETETKQDIKRKAMETAADLLDVSTVAFYSFYEDEWTFRPDSCVSSTEFAERIDDLPEFEPGVGDEWRAFAGGQTAVFDDLQTRETEYDFDRAIRSELTVPIADRGALILGDTRPAVFDEWMISLVETLGATIEAALNRAESEQELRQQHQELQEVELLNQQIREISHTIVKADTRAELEQSVCGRLVASDSIEFAWIGRVDLETKTVTPKAKAGTGEGYLDSVAFTLEEDTNPEPSIEAVRSREVSRSLNIASDIQHGEWRAAAIERGFQSVVSIPLIYNEAFYGVLSVYKQGQSGVSDALQPVLEDLCDLVANAAFAIEQTAVMQTEGTAELQFEVQDQTDLFCRLAAVLGCELDLVGIVPQPEGSTLAFVSVADGVPEKLLHEAEQLNGIESGNMIERANDTLVQLRLAEPYIDPIVSERGIMLRGLWADSARCRLTIEVPKSADTRQTVALITSQYQEAQLLAKQESTTSSGMNESMPRRLLEAVTPRQREVVETAYRCGYFDSPRRASGDDMAELFGFSNAAFHQHVRKAEQTLFAELIEDVGNSLTAVKALDSE